MSIENKTVGVIDKFEEVNTRYEDQQGFESAWLETEKELEEEFFFDGWETEEIEEILNEAYSEAYAYHRY